jgi:hypothetical protein
MFGTQTQVEMGRWNEPLPIAFDDRKCALRDVLEDEFHFILPSICISQENIQTLICWFKPKHVQVYSIVKLRISRSCNKACNMYIQSTVLTWFCICSNIISSPISSILYVSVNLSVCSSILLAGLWVTFPTRLICIYGWLLCIVLYLLHPSMLTPLGLLLIKCYVIKFLQ